MPDEKAPELWVTISVLPYRQLFVAIKAFDCRDDEEINNKLQFMCDDYGRKRKNKDHMIVISY